MKHALIYSFLLCMIVSCGLENRRVNGNNKQTEQSRGIGRAARVRVEGDFEVTLVPSDQVTLKISGDEALLPYIVTETKDGWIDLRTKDDVSLSGNIPTRVTITLPVVEEVELGGNGKVTGQGKFTGGNKLSLALGGSGRIDMQVNTPTVNASIGGSGVITVSGETASLKVSIGGSGNFKGEDLKAEDVVAIIGGSGNVHAFADHTIKADIAGSGNVVYRGKATATSSIAGSGQLKQE